MTPVTVVRPPRDGVTGPSGEAPVPDGEAPTALPEEAAAEGTAPEPTPETAGNGPGDAMVWPAELELLANGATVLVVGGLGAGGM